MPFPTSAAFGDVLHRHLVQFAAEQNLARRGNEPLERLATVTFTTSLACVSALWGRFWMRAERKLPFARAVSIDRSRSLLGSFERDRFRHTRRVMLAHVDWLSCRGSRRTTGASDVSRMSATLREPCVRREHCVVGRRGPQPADRGESHHVLAQASRAWYRLASPR